MTGLQGTPHHRFLTRVLKHQPDIHGCQSTTGTFSETFSIVEVLIS
jgi:hypothetical protein